MKVRRKYRANDSEYVYCLEEEDKAKTNKELRDLRIHTFIHEYYYYAIYNRLSLEGL